MTPGGVPADLPQLSPKASDSPSAPAATPAHPLLDEAAEFAQRVAVLWYSLDGSLDRLVLGDFFAKGFRKELHQTIFKMWIELHDFRNKAIDVALRQFLGGFKLLGEAQVVDRTMEVFAAHYCRMNPSAFSSANTAFILSFTICMLNTDAHSIHVVDKMSKEAFIRMNKGVDDGKDLDSELLSSIYDRITSKEIKLRPLKARSLAHGGTMHGTQTGAAAAVGRKSNIAVAVLGSIPILRRLVPIAESIGDAVMIPVDAAGNILFNTAQRKRSQNYSAEFHEVFREAMSMLREHQNTIGEGSLTVDTNDSDHHRRQGSIEGTSTPSLNGTQSSMIMFVEADSLEHALPMWDLTVEIVVDALLVALQEACSVVRYATKDEVGAATGDDAAAQHGLGTSPPLGPEGSVSNGHFAETSPGYTEGMARVEQLIKGVLVTVRVCAALGALPHAHRLLERLFQLSTLQQVITLQRHDKKLAVCTVKVKQRIPSACLRCAVAVLEALAVNGNVCTADMWSIGYQIVSYIDALSTFLRENSRVAKGESGGTSPTTGGMYSSRRSLQHAVSVNLPTPNDAMATVPAPPKSTTLPSTQPSAFAAAAASLSSDAAQPSHFATAAELQKCQQILDDLYAVSPYLLWVERLYDVTSASSQSLLQMVNGLCKVCVEELEVGRIFSLSRLTEFCTVCTTIVSRMQWRDLWANCEPLFVAAGSKDSAIALQAIDGLKGIAYHYLLKEELSLYKFQKELLQPFERILMRNNEKDVRVAIIRAVHDMIENRSVQLASGWSVILSLLSRGALIPELVHMSWSGCKQLVTRHLPHLSECFHDFIFCLTSFASNTADVHIAFQGASYLVACGTWLQVGLVPLPPCFEEDEDAEEAAALRSPSDSTSSAHKSSVDGGDRDDDNTSIEGSSSLNGSSMLSMDDAALAPQHGGIL
uniref:SEC7 domain-containing protein n=1 Tax=Bodo saltans TaxID=75058 RepID=B6DTH6_BODSA|nr:hypothetical protein [Bodo saltans]